MEQGLDISRLRRILRKRIWWLILPFFVVVIPVCVISLVLDDIFRSSAVILVENPRIPPNMVPSTVTTYVDQRIQSMTQEAISRTRILNLVSKHNLLPEKREKLMAEDLVERIQKRIMVTPIDAEIKKAEAQQKSLLTIAFRLSYEDEDPKKSQRVTNELASYYMEKNIEQREKHAKTTSKFLQEQVHQAKSRLSDLEARLAAYRDQHLEELPDFTTLNMQRLEKLNSDITNLNMQIRSMEEQRAAISSRLTTLDPMWSANDRVLSYDERIQQAELELAGLTARYTKKHPSVQAKSQEISLLETKQDSGTKKLREQLQNLELELADMKSRYTDKHPAVQSKMLEIEKVRKDLEASPKSSAKTQTVKKKPLLDKSTNPAYISLKADLEKIEASLNSAKQERERLEKNAADVYNKMHAMPLVSKEYNEMMADYQNARLQLTEMQNKLSAAQVSQGMEEEQLGETFHIVEPPFLPERPVKPNRIAIIILGAFFGLGLSGACVALTEHMDKSVRSVRGLERLVGMRVWTVIPSIITDEDRRRGRRRRIAVITGSLVTIIALVTVVHFAVMDLYVLAARVDRLIQKKF